MSTSSYANYQEMMSQVCTALSEMSNICDELGMNEAKAELKTRQEKLEKHRFSVGIMGEFKRGKSTVINSLLAKEVMPADILPCSATMNRVTYDLTPHAQLIMQDGSVKNIEVEELTEYVTKLTAEHESRAAEVSEAVVYYPCPFCQNGVDIVDTPGLNDDERMNQITENVIPKLDAVIMVIVPGSPFSISEADFVRNKLMTSDLSRLIFLVNKIDTVRRKSDRARVVQEIKEKIKATVLEKTEEIYGSDSKEYQDAVQKLGNIRIYPFSGLDALEGKMNSDEEMIEASGTRQFEDVLRKMLTEERGALELNIPVNVIYRTANDVAQIILTRYEAMNIDDYAAKKEESLRQIEQSRQEALEEKKRLKQSMRHTRETLRKRVDEFYPVLEEKLHQIVTNYAPSNVKELTEDKAVKAASQLLSNDIKQTIDASLANFTEKLNTDLQGVIQQEASISSSFTVDMAAKMQNIMRTFEEKSKHEKTTNLIATGADVLTDFIGIPGLGGLVSGFQAAGIKGGIIGGGIGLAGNLMAYSAMAAISAPLLPALVISCAVGTILSKTVCHKIFAESRGKKNLEELRSQMHTVVTNIISDLRTSQNIEDWVTKTVNDRFEELITNIDEECEKILKDTESTIREIEKDISLNAQEQEHRKQYLSSIGERCTVVINNISVLRDRIKAVLDSQEEAASLA